MLSAYARSRTIHPTRSVTIPSLWPRLANWRGHFVHTRRPRHFRGRRCQTRRPCWAWMKRKELVVEDLSIDVVRAARSGVRAVGVDGDCP